MTVTVILNNISRCVGLIAKTIFHIVMLDAQLVTNRWMQMFVLNKYIKMKKSCYITETLQKKNEGQEELTIIRHRQQWEQDTEQKQTTQKKKSKTKPIKKTNIESDEQHGSHS